MAAGAGAGAGEGEGEGATSNLQLYWENFFKAETGTYEKSTWLDLFLAEFLIRVNEGANPKELIKFCPVSGVVSLVGCELLCGIHRVTSSITAHRAAPAAADLDAPATPSTAIPEEEAKGEDAAGEHARVPLQAHTTSLFTRANAQSAGETLRRYLLGGAAWRCLALLRALGVEGLSCCRQLSSVLVWVFGELGGDGGGGGGGAARTPAAAPAPPPAPVATPIHHLFSQRIWSKQKVSGTQVSKNNSAGSSEKSSSAGRSRQTKTDSSESKTKRKHLKQEQSSESGDSNEDLQILNRSLAIKVCSPEDDFQYFESPVPSTEFTNDTLYSDPYYVPKKAKPKADDFMSDKHKEIINSEITTFEFTLLITDLLQELCRAESSLSGSEGSQISVQCINFTLRNLCSLQFGSLPSPSQYDSQEVSRIKVALTELLIVSLDKVLIHSDLCAKLINNGILPMLLRILEDVICKCSSKYRAKEDQNRAKLETPSKTESENLLKFVFGIGYSITAFFHCLLMQCRTIDKLREFTDQFKLYGECLKGGLLKDCIELMIRIPGVQIEDSIVLIKKLIESIGRLISGMKRVRSEVVHSAACPRSRHKVCRQRVTAGMHHHHDILGEAGTSLPLSSACCISVLYGTLTSLVADDEVSAQSVLRNKIIRVMLSCGVCCCFSPGFLMESVVRLMLTQHSVANLCLQLLEHTVYGDLGASVLIQQVTDQLPCLICQPCDDKRDLVRKYCPHGVSSVERKSVWSFLIHYNSLLQLDNHNNVLHATVSHLLRVTPKCRTEMKYELLFSVIYPTFIVAKHRYMIRLEESAYFLTVSCLNIFASLLNTVTFAEQFIQKGGLSYVLELVSLTEFSNQCCSILEIAIVVEIFKLMKDNSDMTYFREVSSLSSVQMLFKSLAEMTDKCYKIYKIKLPADKFEELCDVSKERETLAFTPAHRSETQTRKMSAPQTIKTSFASSENVIEDSLEDYIEVLKNICTFWKTCASLCLYSPMFREYVASEGVFLDSYALLKLLLHYVSECECGPLEMRVLIQILEALLTMQFAVSDVTSGRSKDASCSLLRAALAPPAGPAAPARPEDEGGGLRALCEALIRVAVAEPSRTHTMPRVTIAKVPALGGWSARSSADGSASEDSAAAGPFASEHSEPAPSTDEGYEADVEVGRLDGPASGKPRKLTASPANMSGVTGWAGAGAECGEYARSGELAHPELCGIVVDILTQLIHKLLTSPHGDDDDASQQRADAGARLARACCARLAGALAGARAAPPHLLQRLLAPHAAPARLLAVTDEKLEELQRSILELVVAVASLSVSGEELGAFLRLFTAPAPPMRLLLAALRTLAAAAEHNTPDCILTFPINIDNKDCMQPVAASSAHVPARGATSQSAQAEAAARRLHEAHLRAGIKSAWSRGAARCGVEGAGWAPWMQGFAVVLWLRTAPPAPASPTPAGRHQDWDTADEWQGEPHAAEPKKSPTSRKQQPPPPPQLAHVFSAGHEWLLFELWLDTATGNFTLRLTRPEAGSDKVVSETVVDGGLAPRRWSCVGLNVREVVHKRKTHVQVTLFVNGCECETVSLPVQGILVRKVTPTNVLVGDAVRGGGGGGAGGGGGGVFHMSHASVYRAPVLSAHCALHLAAHGPDHACQVRCESPNFPLLLTPNVLNSNIDWDQVYEMSSSTLRELHDSLLLTFSAHAPHIMNLYHQTVAAPTVFGGRVASAASLVGAGAAGAGGGGGAAIPEALYTVWAGAALASRHRGLAPALHVLGGPQVLLYLFARVVELDGSAEEQAAALGVLLRVCRCDARLHAQLHAGAVDLLHTVLAAPQCRIHHHMLKVILDEACSSPIISSSGGGGVVVCARPDTVVVEPRLLVLLAQAWRHLDTQQEVRWEVEGVGGAREARRGSAWALALCCLRVLALGGGPAAAARAHAFNHYQMSRVDLLRHILTACKERFLNSECGPLSPPASNDLVEVVRGLLGAPPPLDHLALLCDFLLLMHQASDTFVTHSRANFYFLLTPEPHPLAHLAAARRRAGRRTRSRHASSGASDTRSSSSVTSEDVANDNVPGAREDRLDNISVDSARNNNLIVKEGRSERHNISSTSETSEQPVEESGDAGAGEGDGELADYVVVGGADAGPAPGEGYASGGYQQGVSVRAGAEPGWTACEGLLLLLRDAVAVLPDHALAQALCGAGAAESVLVLCKHPAGGARAAAVRALAALQRRAAACARADVHKNMRAHNYYLHLANQISLYPGSWELAAACAALVTKCDVPLEDQLDDDIWTDVTEEAALRSPPLLALLPCCLHDVPLAHNVTLLIRRLIDKTSLKLLTEVSAVEVVVRSIRTVGLTDDNCEGRELLLEDLGELLHRFAGKALASQHSMQTVIDMHHMLSYVELAAETGSGAARAAREAQLALFAAQLDQLEERLHSSYQQHTKYANYFTTVLSSAVSLGSESASRAERTELSARHLATVVRAVGFLLTLSPRHCTRADAALVERLLATLLPAVSGASPQRPKWWAGSGGGGGGADWASPLQELFWWAASPAGGVRALQPALLRALYLAPPPAVQLLTPTDPPALRKLAVYLLTILKHVHGLGELGPPAVELAVTDWARGWAVGTQAGLPERLPGDALAGEAERLLAADEERWARAAAKQRQALAKVVSSKEVVAGKVSESAMSITRQVVGAQNGARKAFLEHLRRVHSRAAAAHRRWHELIDAYTHEQAVWHCAASYPQSWQLDATEGPGRVRVRLRRAHLDIPPRFLKPRAAHRAETVRRAAPLRSVVGCSCGARGALAARLQLHETVAHTARVTYVTVASETAGELLLSDRCIHFVPDEPKDDATKRGEAPPPPPAVPPALVWPLEAVVQVATRRWCLQERAAELFLSSGHAHLLAFADVNERTAFLKALGACHLPNRSEPDTLGEAMGQWRAGAITNWEYLMRLNGLAGRSYNDLMQYPVLPFVVADYSSRILNLEHPDSFRDLARPMAVQNKNREQHYINTYNDLRAARREGCSPLLSRQPHHYPSLYSNSGGVLHYLVRLPPFTQLFLNYQDNNFDMPDRTFHSLPTTWRLITQDSPTDVKELIPELFYLPELFHNNEDLNLGMRQCGAPVDDVALPPWAPDARLFTLVHRQALEAAHVTERLPHWIDLVFGYKQTGQAAIDAVNVFPACTYYGFDPLSLEDEVDRTAAAAMVRTYGQAPRQLLRAPHPHRAPDLVPAPAQHPQIPIWSGVEGARWGRYCGSPALPPPVVVARRSSAAGGGAGAALFVLPHARSVAVATRHAALVAVTGDGGAGSSPGGGGGGGAGGGGLAGALALLSWGHSDSIVRLKRRRDARPELLLHVPPADQITKVASSCAAAGAPSPVFIGHASGRVLCVRLRAPAAGAALAPRAHVRQLHAHGAEISDVHVCARAGLLATASVDGKIVLWDLNSLSYIRTLPNRDMSPVTHVTISATLCDVASVHDAAAPRAPPPAPAAADDTDSYERDDTYKYMSLVRVHTVNARFVGSVKVSELVTCVCYSAAGEGVSVNCVAAGLAGGGVRLYSAWDLRAVAYIPPADRALPLTSLTYSVDSSLLFGCYADGLAVAWESGGNAHAHGKPAPVRVLPAHALF